MFPTLCMARRQGEGLPFGIMGKSFNYKPARPNSRIDFQVGWGLGLQGVQWEYWVQGVYWVQRGGGVQRLRGCR